MNDYELHAQEDSGDEMKQGSRSDPNHGPT